MVFLRQLASTLANPLLIALAAAACALALRALNARRAAFALCAFAVLYLGSTPIVALALLRPLETEYPPLPESGAYAGVRSVVVLGSRYSPTGALPVTAALDREGLARIVEAVRIFRRIHASMLVLSGGALSSDASPVGYALLARDLGVDRSALVLLDQSRNTKEEARAIASVLGASPFILVTSASHMPRAMLLMRAAGAHPIAAPTGQLAVDPGVGLHVLEPSPGALHETDLALHEYLGLFAAKAGLE
jgi:uncharacterized SAM-binding protein YcdF (DUF218 family)